MSLICVACVVAKESVNPAALSNYSTEHRRALVRTWGKCVVKTAASLNDHVMRDSARVHKFI